MNIQGPLVSCVMPTRGRAAFLQQSIFYFRNQDYEPRELIIVYDEPSDLPHPLPEDERIQYIQSGEGASIGAKRQLGNEHARGRFIAQWDDDDVYGSERLRRQLAPILAGSADVTALSGTVFFDLENWVFWTCTKQLHCRMFFCNVAAGTLVYEKTWWSNGSNYSDANLREDADFLDNIIAKGARLFRLDGQAMFLYLRHGENSWRFQTGVLEDPEQWQRVPEPNWLTDFKAYYLHMRICMSREKGEVEALVSCIMPTADRPQFVSQAIQNFRQQDYENRELIIVDDGHQSVEGLVPDDPSIRYVHLNQRQLLGTKRNLACKLARGSVIAHWDDDDVYASNWISHSLAALQASGADVVGLSNLTYHDPAQNETWLYAYPREERPWVAGATMVYHKSVWKHQPFARINQGEDSRFLWDGALKHIVDHGRSDLYVARLHTNNTSSRPLRNGRWHALGADPLPLPWDSQPAHELSMV